MICASVFHVVISNTSLSDDLATLPTHWTHCTLMQSDSLWSKNLLLKKKQPCWSGTPQWFVCHHIYCFISAPKPPQLSKQRFWLIVAPFQTNGIWYWVWKRHSTSSCKS